MPASLSLPTSIFVEGDERNRAVGLYGGTAGLGFVVGMASEALVGALRWGLLLCVGIVIIVLAVVLFGPRSEAAWQRSSDGFD